MWKSGGYHEKGLLGCSLKCVHTEFWVALQQFSCAMVYQKTLRLKRVSLDKKQWYFFKGQSYPFLILCVGPMLTKSVSMVRVLCQ